MANKYFDGVITNTNVSEDIDTEFKNYILGKKNIIDEKMDNLRVADALEEVIDLFRRCNKYIDETTPWVLAKEDSKKDRLSTVIYNLVEGIRIGAVLLQAFMPETSEKIFYQINTDLKNFDSIEEFGGYKSGSMVNNPEVLFQRIEN